MLPSNISCNSTPNNISLLPESPQLQQLQSNQLWSQLVEIQKYLPIVKLMHIVGEYAFNRSPSDTTVMDHIVAYSTSSHPSREVDIARRNLIIHPDTSIIDRVKLLTLFAADHPKDALTYTLLGTMQSDLKEPDKALQSFKNALQLDTTDYDAYLGLGKIYTELNQLTKAKKAFENAFALDITNCHGYLFAGMLSLKFEENSNAKELFQTAYYLLNTDAIDILLPLCTHLFELGATRQARDLLKKIVTISPDIIMNNIYLLNYLIQSNKFFKDTEWILEKIIESDNKNHPAYTSVLLLSKTLQEKIELLQMEKENIKKKSITDKNISALTTHYMRLVFLESNFNEFEDAKKNLHYLITEFQKAKQSPEYLLLQLGTVLIELKDFATAVTTLNKAILECPLDDDEAKELLSEAKIRHNQSVHTLILAADLPLMQMNATILASDQSNAAIEKDLLSSDEVLKLFN